MSFSVLIQFFCLCFGGSKISLFDNLAQEARAQKHYRNRGCSKPIIGEQTTVIKRPFLDKKNQNQIFQFLFWVFLLFEHQKHNTLLKPQFFGLYSVFANTKRLFSKSELKTGKFEETKKLFLHPIKNKKR